MREEFCIGVGGYCQRVSDAELGVADFGKGFFRLHREVGKGNAFGIGRIGREQRKAQARAEHCQAPLSRILVRAEHFECGDELFELVATDGAHARNGRVKDGFVAGGRGKACARKAPSVGASAGLEYDYGLLTHGIFKRGEETSRVTQRFDVKRNDFGLWVCHQKVNHFRERHFAFKA